MGTELDVIGAIEAAYDATEDESRWLERLVTTLRPSFGAGVSATSAFTFDFAPDGRMTMSAVASLGDPPFTRQHFEKQQSVATLSQLRQAFQCDMFTLLSRVVGMEAAQAGLRNAGMIGGDSLGLRSNATPDRGLILTTLVPAGFRIRNRALWLRLASHLGAAMRLRSAKRPTPENAAAILTPSGKFEHATAPTEGARSELADAAKSMDRARGKLRRLDPEEASSLWRAMVRGEWSLVEWFDHDGKRFLVAHDNQVPAHKPTPKLSAREYEVVACAAMGHSNKLIAYDLGLSVGTVSVMLARAAAKLGVDSRPALIRAFAEMSSGE